MPIHGAIVVCYKLEMESKLKYKCPKNFAAYIEPHTHTVLFCTAVMHAQAFSSWTIAIVIILCAVVTSVCLLNLIASVGYFHFHRCQFSLTVTRFDTYAHQFPVYSAYSVSRNNTSNFSIIFCSNIIEIQRGFLFHLCGCAAKLTKIRFFSCIIGVVIVIQHHYHTHELC